MKRIFKILLIVTLTLSPLSAKAFTLTNTQIKNEVAKLVLNQYKQYTDAELEVTVLSIPFKSTNIPNGQISFSIESSSKKFSQRDLEKVTVFVNGKAIRKFNAPIQVKAFSNVLVASSSIPRDRVINPSTVSIEKREISSSMDYVLKADSLNKELITKKYFTQGEVIDKRFLKAKPDIFRNAIVTVLFQTNNLTITLDAVALSDGALGDNICILSKDYKKIYKGTVIGQNKVLIQI